MKKRILAFIMCVSLVLELVPLQVYASVKNEQAASTESETVSAGDISDGNEWKKDITGNNDGEGGTQEGSIQTDSTGIVASGISRGCAWTIDTEGNLVVRDGSGEYDWKEWEPWGWEKYKENIKTVDMDISFTDMGGMFWDCTNLETAKVKIKTINKNARVMFYNCSNLKNLDLQYMDTSAVNDMNGMFYNCSSLTSLDLSNFDTSNVTDMSDMFYNCSGLTNLNLSSFNTSNVTNMSNMFYGCSGLTSLDLSNFNTSKVTDMSDMFSGNYLTGLNLSNFDTSNVTNMRRMFSNCFGLTSLDLSNFNTSNVTDMSYMFGESYLTELNLSNFDTSNVENMCCMFYRCFCLTSLNLSNFDTSNVINMDDMFNQCGASSINISGWNISNVKYMRGMFEDCRNLRNLNMDDIYGGLDEGKLISMKSMFAGCENLEGVDLSNFNTSNVTDMGQMFSQCQSLTSLDLSNFNTSNVTDMGQMFSQCQSLTSLDLSNFNTSNVTDMGQMFSQCQSLTSLDLSNFNTSNVTDMSFMFFSCQRLTSLDVSNFDISNVTSMDYIFASMYSMQSIKIFPNSSWEIDLPRTPMYDDKGNSYTTVFPKGLSKSMWLYSEKRPSVDKSESKISEDVAVVKISDKSNRQIIKNASISDGASNYTGTDIIEIPVTDAVENKTLTIAADGYYTVVKNVTLKKGQVTYLSLQKQDEESDLAILDVTGVYKNKMYDFMGHNFNMGYTPNVEGISDLTYGSVDIIVNVAGKVSKYELIQDNKVIQTNTDGRFEVKVITQAGDTEYISPVTTEFVNGKKVSIRVTDANGKQTLETLSINVSRSYTSKSTVKETGSFSIGKSLKVTVPDDVPLIGGGTMEVGLNKQALPVELSIDEDGKVRFALNKDALSSMDEFESDYKNLSSRAKYLSGASKAFGGTPQTFGGGFFNAAGKVYGYGEGNLSELEEGSITLQVGLYAEIEGKGGYKQYFFVGFVPLNLFVEGSVSAKPELLATLQVKNYKITDFDITGGTMNAKIQLTVGGGVGVGVEVNASVSGSANYMYKPARDYQKVWLEASGKVSLVIGWFEKKLWNSKNYNKVIYESGNDTKNYSVTSDIEEEIITNDSFKPMSRNYLANQAGYHALAASGIESVNTDISDKQIVKAAVYPSADPKIVYAGGKQYLFWLEDIITRSANNRAALVYSVSDDGKKWSEPVQIIPEEEDSTPDLGYDVYTDEKNIYIVWQDGVRELGEEEDIEAMVESMSIRSAVMDAATGQILSTETLTDHAAYYMYPQVTTEGTDRYVAYVENLLDGESIVANNTHKFFYTVNGSEKQIALPDKYQIINMDLGTFSDGIYAVCEVDTDGDIQTDTDRELFAFNLKTGNSVRLTENEVADTYPVLSKSGNLYWNCGNEIQMMSRTEDTKKVVMSGEEFSNAAIFTVITTADAKDWILFENADWDADGTLAVYGIEQKTAGEYEQVIKLADVSGGIVSKITGLQNGKELTVGLLEGDFLEDGTILKDLCVYHIGENTDISVTGVTYEIAQAAEGTALPLKVECYNNGNTTIQQAEIAVDGKTICTLTDLNLKPGESRELAVEGYTVPEGLKEPKECTLTVKVPDDSREQNNEAKFSVGLPDAKVSVSTRQLEGHYWLDIVVNNENTFASSGTLRVYKDKIGGEVIFETDYSGLVKGTANAYTLSLEEYDTECKNYYVDAQDDMDGNIGNNSTYVYIGYGSGVDIPTEEKPETELTGISLTESEIALQVGETHTFAITVAPDDAIVDNAQLLWSSSNPKVATVDDTGVVTALSSGSAVISVHFGNLSAQSNVTVQAGKQDVITILFDTQCSQRVEPLSGILAGSQVHLPKLKVNGDKFFDGWYTQAEGGELISDSYVFTKSMTVYAHWGDRPDGLWAEELAEQTYTGKAIKPQPVVYDRDTLLVEGKDYTLSYKNNTKVMDKESAKAPTVVIKGKGNYKGTVNVTFSIVPKSIEDEDIRIDDITVIANGKLQKKVPVVKWGSKTLRANKDYSIEYTDEAADAYKAPGVYTITLTGKDCYSGTRTVTLTIASDKTVQIGKCSVSSIVAQPYREGNAIEPVPVVKYKGQVLAKDVDYTVTYKNNTDVGTAQVVITGMNNYVGSRTITFKITGTAISKAKITYDKTVEYNGNPQEPQISLTIGENVLQQGKDYVVEYQKNVNVGNATALIKGIGGYTGSVKKGFRITAYDLTLKDVTIADEANLSAFYELSGAKPAMTVYYKGQELVAGKDYTLSYSNNKKVADQSQAKAPTVTLRGKGNFKGTRTVTFSVLPKDVADEQNPIFITAADVLINTKGKYQTKITVKDSQGKKLTLNKDYEIIGYYVGKTGDTVLPASANLTAGTTLRVAICGKGNYIGTKEAEYKVMQYDLAKVRFKIANQIYTGEEITFAAGDFGNSSCITVQSSGKLPLPVYGEDYIITGYRNNVKTGSATLILKGIGDNWGGTKEVTFRIVPKELKWFFDLIF